MLENYNKLVATLPCLINPRRTSPMFLVGNYPTRVQQNHLDLILYSDKEIFLK